MQSKTPCCSCYDVTSTNCLLCIICPINSYAYVCFSPGDNSNRICFYKINIPNTCTKIICLPTNKISTIAGLFSNSSLFCSSVEFLKHCLSMNKFCEKNMDKKQIAILSLTKCFVLFFIRDMKLDLP